MQPFLQLIGKRFPLACAVLALTLATAVAALLQWETPFRLQGAGLALALAVALAASLLITRRKGRELWPEGKSLWQLAGLSLLLVMTCDLCFFAYPLQMPAPLLVTAASLCLLWAVAGRWSLVFWCPFLLLEMAQIAGYLQYGARINSLVIAETLESSAEEAAAYLTAGNLLLLLVACGCSLFFCYLIHKAMRGQKRLPLLNTALLAGLLAALFCMALPPHKHLNDIGWPVMEAWHLGQSCCEARSHNFATVNQAESLVPPSESPSSMATLHGGEGVVLVVHIGESVRADRMSINGYERDTTPWLRQQPGVINFPDCISAACDTCQAQIAILTDARRDVFETDPAMQPRTGSVLSLFKRHGFKVYSFFGMREGQKLKYDRVIRVLTRCSEESFHAPGSPWTSIPQMAETLRANNAGQNLVFFINNEGSHTPFSHYDVENPPFTPAGAGFGNPASHAQEVNNAYDNTVHYTDEFVRRVVRLLQGRPYVYLYISDHGEYLGHDGIWGRAALGESRLSYHHTGGSRVGMFIITSPEFDRLHPHFAEAVEQLKAHASMTVGQEHIFHTLLGLFGITSPFYQPQLDLSSPSAQPYTGERPPAIDPVPRKTDNLLPAE